MMNSKNKRKEMQKGFTLIEIMTALSVFIVIMTISMGLIVGVFTANGKAQAMRVAMNNLNLAMETMSREIRFGTEYQCPDSEHEPNCPSGYSSFTFTSSEGERISYRTNGSQVQKRIGSGIWNPVTSPEISVNELEFFVFGVGHDGNNTNLQPKVIMRLKGQSGAGFGKYATFFTVQTMVSQRVIDTAP